MERILILLIAVLCLPVYAAFDSQTEAVADVTGKTKTVANYHKRVNSITGELSKFSGKKYPVIIQECKGWAEARDDGMVVIDLTISRTRARDVVAFLIAHEWGHLTLGHVKKPGRLEQPVTIPDAPVIPGKVVPSSNINPYTISTAMFSRRDEREADSYAVKFMAHKKYDVESFVKFLLAVPDDQRLHYGLHTHDTREVRTEFIREKYKALKQPPPKARTGSPASISYEPASYDLGRVTKRGTVERIVKVTNTGGSDLLIKSVRSNYSCAKIDSFDTLTPPGESSEIKIKIDFSKAKPEKTNYIFYVSANTRPRKITSF